MARRRRKRRHTAGLGRKPAKGRGPICVTVRTGGKGRKSHASTRCFATSSAANTHLMRAVGGRGEKVKSALIYRRKRKG